MKTPGMVLLSLLGLLLVPPPAGADRPAAQQASTTAEAKLSRLQGSASLGRNRHVVGATVLVRPQGQASQLYVTASDSRGRFRVDDLPDGEYRVEVRRDGLEPIVKDHIGLRFPFRAVVELTMRPLDPADPAGAQGFVRTAGGAADLLTVRGKVLERGGAEMPEVELRFVRADGTFDPRRVRSTPEGGFELLELPAGTWRLQVRVVGYLPIWTHLEFEVDTELTVSMVGQPAGYQPSPLELMPPEQPIPPAGLVKQIETGEEGTGTDFAKELEP